MPERFAAEVTYADRPIRVRIEATFDGQTHACERVASRLSAPTVDL